MRILQIGVDKTTLEFLRTSGVLVEESEPITDAEGLEAWLGSGYCDAVVVNIDTGKFGIYVARHLRSKKIDTPVIGISKGSSGHLWPEERALFLENGGDDLLHFPPNPRELIASIQAMGRRFKGSALSFLEFRSGDALLKVNLTAHSAFVNGRDPLFTNHERWLLLYMATHPNRVLSKDSLLENLYSLSPDNPPDIKIIDVFIHKIRKKMSRIHPDAEKLIETVWGRGYRLCTDVLKEAVAS